MAVPPEAIQLAGGLLLGLSLAAPPGPVMAIMATASARGRTGESIRTALGAITGDAVWLLLALAGFVAFLQDRPRAVGALGLAGAALLLWLAHGAYRAARAGIGTSERRGGYLVGFLTILTSPFSLAWWLANGAILLLSLGWIGIAGLFAMLVLYTLAFTYGMRWIGARVKRAAEGVAWASAVLLAAFAGWVAWASLAYLGWR